MKKLLIFVCLVAIVFILTGASRRRGELMPQSSGSTPATATDTFNRANADPMSTTMSDGTSTWTVGPGALNNTSITSNGIGTSGSAAGARVLTPTFSANQISTITAGPDNFATGPAVRLASTTDADGYMAYPSSATSITIYRIDDTGTIAFVALGANVTITALTAGETLGLGISGTTLTLYTNGVSTGATRTDSTYSTGQPGVYVGSNSRVWDAFTASDL